MGSVQASNMKNMHLWFGLNTICQSLNMNFDGLKCNCQNFNVGKYHSIDILFKQLWVKKFE